MHAGDREAVGLWRTAPPSCPLNTTESEHFDIGAFVFPSARQAISALLQSAGLSRAHRVAIPEWSSHCVISAVGAAATPIPMREVVQHGIPVEAVLLYEQWGWPLPPAVCSAVLERFPRALLVMDRVDSAAVEVRHRIPFPPDQRHAEVISLSKLLGLPGGGLARLQGDYLPFSASATGDLLSARLWAMGGADGAVEERLQIHKSHVPQLHPQLRAWLASNSLFAALRQEETRRRANLRALLECPACVAWPEWMRRSYEMDAAPGIVPLHRDKTEQALKAAQTRLLERHRIETAIYHFNWSGDPLQPQYEKCLAFPIHGMIANVTEYIASGECNLP